MRLVPRGELADDLRRQDELTDFALDDARTEVSIGRESWNDWIIGYQKISRGHARIVRIEGGYCIEDLDSSNGTWLERAGERVRLEPGNWYDLHAGDVIHLELLAIGVENDGPAFPVPAAAPQGTSAGEVSLVSLWNTAEQPPAADDPVPPWQLDTAPGWQPRGDVDASAVVPEGERSVGGLSDPVSPRTQAPRGPVVALCRGMGVDPGLLMDDAHLEATLEELGRVIAATMRHLYHLMGARYQARLAFRLNNTDEVGLQPLDNNAFKIGHNPALSHVDPLVVSLLDRNPSFMSLAEAVEQSFKDLEAHQTAELVGMRAALKETMAALDPEKISRQVRDDKRLTANSATRCWERYKDLHAEMSGSERASFDKGFGEFFRQAYLDSIDGREP